QAEAEHDQRIDPRRAKRAVAEDGEFKEQPYYRENNDGPLVGSQLETVRFRQFAPRVDVEDDRRKVDDGGQQGCRAEQVAQRVAAARIADTQYGEGSQYDLDQNAA